MRPLILLNVLVSFAVFAALSCEYKKEQLAYPQAPGCDTLSMSYTKNIVPLMDQYCNNCHGNTNGIEKGGGIILTTYEDVNMFAEAGILLDNITWAAGANPMPKDGIKMPDCAINQIKAWINQGRKEN
mgnify:FL=1